jgi:LmbE family N-acetylglucosaminyl deacetylase
MKNVMVIAPHPDDETLGCGGIIQRFKHEKINVYWLIVTSINQSEDYTKKFIMNRELEINDVVNHYQFNKVFNLNFPTSMLDTIPFNNIVTGISAALSEVKPETLFIPYYGDIHTDHRIVFEACMSSIKWFRQKTIKKVMSYETLSETNFSNNIENNTFNPNTYYDISNYIDSKIKAMNIYRTEIDKHPFPRSEDSIRSLAKIRGSESGYEYAEAFMLIREII